MNWFRSTLIIGTMLGAGCSKTPPLKGGATKSELEAKIGESKNWHDVRLFKDHYEGTAVTSKGEKLIIDVGQSSGTISVHWKQANGPDEGDAEIKW